MKQTGAGVRLALPEDVPALCLIEQRCFSEPLSSDQISRLLESKLASWLVYEDDGQPIASLWYQQVLDERMIGNVAVLPEHRRKGLARRLLMAAEKYEELAIISLEVRAGNIPALKLYRSMGYEEVGRRSAYYRQPTEDAILMTKCLSESSLAITDAEGK